MMNNNLSMSNNHGELYGYFLFDAYTQSMGCYTGQNPVTIS